MYIYIYLMYSWALTDDTLRNYFTMYIYITSPYTIPILQTVTGLAGAVLEGTVRPVWISNSIDIYTYLYIYIFINIYIYICIYIYVYQYLHELIKF
jgi:hypothetical protein